MKDIFAAFVLILISIGAIRGDSNIPPFETHDPSISENFRNIYYSHDTLNSTVTNYIANSVINVKNPPYNAKGDAVYGVAGGTDDTIAIQNALNALPNGGIVFVPIGTYNHTGLTVPTHVSIIGEGAKSSILQYTPATGNGITLSGKVNNFEKIKIYSLNNSNGTAIVASTTTEVTDFCLDKYEIEGFLNGIYLPFGLVMQISNGRILGQSATSGIGIHLGESHSSVVVNMGEIEESYVTGFSTATTLIGSIFLIDQIIIDNSGVAINNESRLFINASWLQPNVYIYSNLVAGYPITATQNYYLTGVGAELDDLTGHVNLALSEDLTALQKTSLTSPGPYILKNQTSFARGLILGTTNTVLWDNQKTFVIESSGASKTPFAIGRYETGVSIPMIELRRVGNKYGSLGLDVNSNIVFISSTSSGNLFTVFTDSTNFASVSLNQSVLATNDTHGFLYIPTAAGTPTGVPKTLSGVAPILVDTSNNKFYFYSGGAWQDLGISGSSVTSTYLSLSSAAITYDQKTDSIAASRIAAGSLGASVVSSSATLNYGAFISTSGTSVLSAASSTYGDVVSTTVIAGDWDCSANGAIQSTSTVTRDIVCISLFSGNTTTDHLIGDNCMDALLPTAASNGGTPIAPWRVYASATTNVYLKERVTYTGAAVPLNGRLSCRRAR